MRPVQDDVGKVSGALLEAGGHSTWDVTCEWQVQILTDSSQIPTPGVLYGGGLSQLHILSPSFTPGQDTVTSGLGASISSRPRQGLAKMKRSTWRRTCVHGLMSHGTQLFKCLVAVECWDFCSDDVV